MHKNVIHTTDIKYLTTIIMSLKPLVFSKTGRKYVTKG